MKEKKKQEEDVMEEKTKMEERERRIWFCLGFFFLCTATICFILSVALHKPQVLCGVPLQLWGGVSLIILNK